jgi:hypothetical protein
MHNYTSNTSTNKPMQPQDFSTLINKVTPLGIIFVIVWQLMQGFNVLLVDAKTYMSEQTKFNYEMLSTLKDIKESLKK